MLSNVKRFFIHQFAECFAQEVPRVKPLESLLQRHHLILFYLFVSQGAFIVAIYPLSYSELRISYSSTPFIFATCITSLSPRPERLQIMTLSLPRVGASLRQ